MSMAHTDPEDDLTDDARRMRLDEPALWHGTVRNAGGPGIDCYGRVVESEQGLVVEVVRCVAEGRFAWSAEVDPVMALAIALAALKDIERQRG